MRCCSFCEYNDGYVYTSLPPMYKCTITGEFHFENDSCSVEFAPVKHGRWIDMDDHALCSLCGATHYGADKNYCPNCGADMRERKES